MKIAIVHLTDLHFTKDCKLEDKIHPFCQALLRAIKGVQEIFFVISGDIANAGLEEEYEVAKKFLSLIKTFISSEHSRPITYIITPGNHDCDFTLDSQLRKNAVRNMNYETIGYDESVLNECLKIQTNFWKFYSHYNAIPSDKMFYNISKSLDDHTVSFFCINTAWMSQLKEKPGSLFFPVKRYESNLTYKSHSGFGVWHHPYNWFNPSTIENNKKEIELFTEHISASHFYGHEHEQTVYNVENINSGERINLFSGAVFNDNKKPGLSGFQVLQMNVNEDFGILKKFVLQSDIYDSTEKNVSFLIKQNKRYNLKSSIISDYESIKIPLSIEGRKEVNLSDIFVLPDIESEKSYSNSLENYISSRKLLESEEVNRVLVDGDAQIGKSSLLTQLYLRLYEQGFSPILLRGIDLKDCDIEKMIKKAFQSQYELPNDFERFFQSPKDQLILLVDDFQDCTLGSAMSRTIFDEAAFTFGRIIIAIDSASGFLPSIRNEFHDFKQYSIKPLGYKRRNDLIERYQYLKPDFATSHEQERFNAIRSSFDDVQAILGDKFMPSYPVFILGILQALEYKPSTLNQTSFGYCYQALILYALHNAGVKNEEIDSYLNFLTELAFEFIRLETETISSSTVGTFYNRYQEKYIVLSFDKIFDKIKKSKILLEENDEITFGYNYILYYLSAKRISDILHTKEGKSIVNKLFSNVHIERNANILVFITHHSKDVSYIKQSILNSMIVLESSPAITLERKDPFYNSLNDFTNELVNDILETSRIPKEQREMELVQQDNESRRNENDPKSAAENFSEINTVLIPFHQAFRSIEIVGQIIKNRKGSLEKSQLLEMVKEIYTTGFRTISYMIELLESSREDIIQTILAELGDAASRYEVETRINRFLQSNNLQNLSGHFY